MNNLKILMVAGEASGDRHGADLIQNLSRTFPGLKVAGIGGDRMAGRGAEIFFHIRDTAVVGLVEILGSVGFFYGLYKRMLREIDAGGYDAVVLIDYPTLNLRLAARAKKRGVPVFYYISPQVWAWHGSRVKKLAQTVTKMLVILPFEEKIYRDAGLPCAFVGHPFLDIVKPDVSREKFCEKHGLDPARKIVGLLPGSRNNEINSLLSVILQSAVIIKKEIPGIQFVLPLAPTISRDRVAPFLKSAPVQADLVEGETFDAMNAADALIIASGSATLEAGLIGTPMVIVYKVSPLTYFLGKRLVKVQYIGLVNIVAGKAVAPELIQHEANPERTADLTLEYLRDEEKNFRTREELKRLRESLGESGASRRAAGEIAERLKKRKGN
ncbi:MAG: lipid-A-disaccharide synthase [Nitrospinae bacterium]|nr:lipid-A-disaccharide synthase [Nitrospinota bacterium]